MLHSVWRLQLLWVIYVVRWFGIHGISGFIATTAQRKVARIVNPSKRCSSVDALKLCEISCVRMEEFLRLRCTACRRVKPVDATPTVTVGTLVSSLQGRSHSTQSGSKGCVRLSFAYHRYNSMDPLNCSTHIASASQCASSTGCQHSSSSTMHSSFRIQFGN